MSTKPSCAVSVQWEPCAKEPGAPAQKQNSTCKASQHAAHCQVSKDALHMEQVSSLYKLHIALIFQVSNIFFLYGQAQRLAGRWDRVTPQAKLPSSPV